MPTTSAGTGTRAARIARRIEAEIIRRGWPIGTSLGSEQLLQQRYRVSRPVLREAVRLVEHHQVARMRRGPHGGLFVTEPDAGPATRAMVIYLEHVGTSIGELLEARLLLEPLASALAADRVDEAGIVRLRGLLDSDRPRPARDELHVVLAELTGNPVLALFVDVLTRLTARYAAGAEAQPPQRIAASTERLADDHTAIVAAVAAGDTARAMTLTRGHVEIVSEWLERYCRPGGADRAGPVADGAPTPHTKRAEALAAAIHAEIASAGWCSGTVFGTEAELLERYGVSRSVLREAVRLLEYHTVARMRRGPGGGLVVTEPSPDASVDTIALYLQYRRPSRADLRLVRDAIEIANVERLVSRRGEHRVAAFLDEHRHPSGTGEEAGSADRAGQAEIAFHHEMAALAGNTVLDVFLRIISELHGRQWDPGARPPPGADDVEAMLHAHARIAEAISDGDLSMAQHRSRRHLAALSTWW